MAIEAVEPRGHEFRGIIDGTVPLPPSVTAFGVPRLETPMDTILGDKFVWVARLTVASLRLCCFQFLTKKSSNPPTSNPRRCVNRKEHENN